MEAALWSLLALFFTASGAGLFVLGLNMLVKIMEKISQ